MTILLNLALLVIGFIMLIKGADWFVEGSSNIARRLGIPQIVVGLTLVAMGTSAPEAAVSITAALKGNADISVGNVLGSNILNILIILGLTSIIVPIAIKKNTIAIEIPFMIAVTIIFVVLGYTGNIITRIEGIILWLLFIGYLAYLFILSFKEKSEDSTVTRPIWLMLLATIIGGAVIVLGSNITVNAATKLATIFGISERFIGLTIVALGTSLPELVTSVTAAKKGNADIAIGNIVGSNIFNILFVLGTSALIIPVKYADSFIIDGILAVACAILLWILVIPGKKLKKSGGIILLLMYAGYFVYLIR